MVAGVQHEEEQLQKRVEEELPDDEDKDDDLNQSSRTAGAAAETVCKADCPAGRRDRKTQNSSTDRFSN